MIKAVFIDWGNTFTGGWEKANKKVDKILAPFSLAWESFSPSLRKFYLLRSTQKIKNDNDFEVCIRKDLGKEIPVKEIMEIIIKGQLIPKENIRAVEHLKKHYKVAILSNNVEEWLIRGLKFNKIEKLFDALIVSSKVGVRKPNVLIYYKALSKLRVRPEESVFVADEVGGDLVTASGLGMKTIWYKKNLGGWGKGDDSAVLKIYKPDATITTFRELPETIENLNNR